MKVKRISVSNFISYRGEHSFDFTPATIYAVYGRNGSGKSTIFIDALMYCLFGVPYKDMPVANVMNDKSEKCFVEIYFKDGKEESVVRRVRDVMGTSLYLNEQPITQENLNTIIGIDKDMFLNSVVFGQGMSGFLLLPDADKKDMIAKINLAFIDEHIDKLNIANRENNQQVENTKSTIEKIRTRLESLREQIEQIDNVIQQHGSIRKEHKKKEAELLDKQQSCLTEITNCTKQVDKVKKQRDKASEEYDKVVDLNRTISREIVKLESLVENYKKDLSVLDSTNCPTCFSVIDKQAKNRIKGLINPKIDSLENKVSKKEKELLALCMEECESRYNELDSGYDFAKKRLQTFKEKLAAVEGELKAVQKALKLQSSQDTELLHIQATKEFKQNKKTLQEEESRLVELEEFGQICEFWHTKYKELRSNMFTTVLQSFTPVCNNILETLTNGRFSVQVIADLKGKKRVSDKFSVIVKDRMKDVNLKRLSGGEKKALTLAMNMSFAILMNKYYAGDWNIIVFDETFDQFDTVMQERIIELLVGLKNKTKKVIVFIAHDEFQHEELESVRIMMSKKGSKIIYNKGEK